MSSNIVEFIFILKISISWQNRHLWGQSQFHVSSLGLNFQLIFFISLKIIDRPGSSVQFSWSVMTVVVAFHSLSNHIQENNFLINDFKTGEIERCDN